MIIQVPAPALLIVPVTAALLEAQKVGKRSRICRNLETVGLPCSERHPGNLDVEAVEIVARTELGGSDLLCDEIITGTGIDGQFRRKLYVSGNVQRPGKSVLLLQGFILAVVLV